MADCVEFFVAGTPAPQGSKRAFRTRTGAVIVDTNQPQLRPWRALIADATRQAMNGRPPLDGPVWVKLRFYFPQPKVRAKHPTPAAKGNGPDVDKLCRAALDGLVDGGLMIDDRQVWTLDATKWELAPGWTVGMKVEAGQ